MVDTYEHLFGAKPIKAKTPLEKGDHPEIDESELCDKKEMKIYMSLIGQLQWLVSLGRFDIYSTLTTMSKFRVAPRKGHLERLKRMFGYVVFTRDAALRVRTGIPDLSAFPNQQHEWAYTVYGKVREQIPADAPEPLGKEIVHLCYVDANLYHCMITGRALTAVLHILNQTLVDWYAKKQATCESSTYSSEIIAARIAVDQIIDLRTTLRYLGVPIKVKTYLFGDNQSVVTNTTIPHSLLNKRHNALSYHRVREAMACGDLLGFYHIPEDKNPANILSKHWGFQQVWPQLKALLFWQGNTAEIKQPVARKQGRDYRDKSPGHIGSSVRHLTAKPHITADIFQLEFPTE